MGLDLISVRANEATVPDVLPVLSEYSEWPEMQSMVADAYRWAAERKAAGSRLVMLRDGRWSSIRARLGSMEVAEHVMIDCLAGMPYGNFQNNLRSNVSHWPETIHFRWSIKKSKDGTRASIIKIGPWGSKLDAETQTVAPPSVPLPSPSGSQDGRIDGLLIALTMKRESLLRELQEVNLAVESVERVMKLLADTRPPSGARFQSANAVTSQPTNEPREEHQQKNSE